MTHIYSAYKTNKLSIFISGQLKSSRWNINEETNVICKSLNTVHLCEVHQSFIFRFWALYCHVPGVINILSSFLLCHLITNLVIWVVLFFVFIIKRTQHRTQSSTQTSLRVFITISHYFLLHYLHRWINNQFFFFWWEQSNQVNFT